MHMVHTYIHYLQVFTNLILWISPQLQQKRKPNTLRKFPIHTYIHYRYCTIYDDRSSVNYYVYIHRDIVYTSHKYIHTYIHINRVVRT